MSEQVITKDYISEKEEPYEESEDEESEDEESEDENLCEENRDVTWVPTIENFKEKFLAKMRQLADKHKTDKIRYFRLEHFKSCSDPYWKDIDCDRTLFTAYNDYDFWLKIYPMEVIYYDLENDFDYSGYLLQRFTKEQLSKMDEDKRIEAIVKQEINFHRLGSKDCNDTIWWVEITTVM